MADEQKRTGKEPVFDTDRAWKRFEKMTAGEPVADYWKQSAEGKQVSEHLEETSLTVDVKYQNENGGMEMKQPVAAQETGKTAEVITKDFGEDGVWRTERPVSRRIRRLTTGIAAAVIVVSLFTTSLGDRVMAAMQQTFRIQHMVGVEITADDLATISSLLDRGSPEGSRSFSLAQYGSLTQSEGGPARTLTWNEAEKRMGGSLLQLGNSSEPSYQPATSLTLQLNVGAVNKLLTRLGGATTLPSEADGKAIQLQIPDAIASVGTLAGKPARLLQFGKPELTVDGGIDVAKVRDAILGLPVLPDSLRTKLAAIADWQSTLPIPTRDGVTTNLRLNGHDAIMTRDGKHRLLMWLNGNRMGLLRVDLKDFPTEAAFRQAAEELVRP
ncbi:hypothetical protein [Paenibacillus koleovorans]|uniref:hypothetical protein n=1 Tax=Paenibacillus koleovorans TaxID=121608 RepID=UPI000FDB219F|nr:hypothetical protein [Paenibacillus koleovorans]